MRLGRRSFPPPLDEAAAYARCHGARSQDVKIVKLPPRRARYREVLATGEELRILFEQRLDARDETEAWVQRKAGSEEPACVAAPAN